MSDYLRKGSATNRFFSILFSIVLVIGLMPLTAIADEITGEQTPLSEQPAVQSQNEGESPDEATPSNEVVSQGEGISTQELSTEDHVTGLTVTPSTLSNGDYARINFSWSTKITGTEQAYYHAGDTVTLDTNMGDLFNFTAPITQDVTDTGTGKVVATLTITADKITVEFNQVAEDMGLTTLSGSYTSPGTVFTAKALQNTETALNKTLTVGDGTAALTWPGLTKTLTPKASGNGSVSPTTVFSPTSGTDSQTFTFTPDAGEELVSVTLVKPDGTKVPITTGISSTGGSYTVTGNELELGKSQLLAEFTSKSATGIQTQPIRKENWGPWPASNSARMNIVINGDGTTSLYNNEGASIDADKQKNNILFEDTLPGTGTFEWLSIKAVLPNWGTNTANKTVPVLDGGGFEWTNSSDIKGMMNKLTQGAAETYDEFKARVAATPLNWGIYTDTAGANSLIINFGSIDDPATPGVKYSDIWADRLAGDSKLNTIAGDDNCVGGKVQYFIVNYYATHNLEPEPQHYENTGVISYTDGNEADQKKDAIANYDIDYSGAFQSGSVGHVVVNKVDANNMTKQLAGANFKLQIENPAGSGTYVDYTGTTTSGTTGADGRLDLFTLIVGKYKLVETSAAPGYVIEGSEFSAAPSSGGAINADGTFEVTGAETTGFGVIVTNPPVAYNVIYDKNATDATGTITDPKSPYITGANWTVLDNNGAITRPGYVFTGWNDKNDGSGTVYPVGKADNVMGTADVTLYAQWKAKNPKAVASPNVTKAFTTTSPARPTGEEEDFEFTITQLTGETSAVTIPTASATQTDAGSLTSPFGSVAFTKAGTYTFKIAETTGSASGYTYDDTTYTWTVTIGETETGFTVTADTLTNDKTHATVTGGAVFTNEYAASPAPAIASPAVSKSITGPWPTSSAKTFNFTCTAGANNPAGGVTGLGTTASKQGTGDVANAFGDSIVFSKPGTYVYTIAETPGTDTGYTYDNTKYTWTVTVTNNGGTLQTNQTLTKEGQTATVAKAEFANTYAVTAGTYTIPTITKNVTGATVPAATAFTFTITGDDSAPLPATATATATIAAGGTSATASLGSINFTAAGTYTYHISETNSGATGWTYDTSTYDIEVVVSDNGGTLSAVGTVTKGGTAASAITFSNAYAPTSVTLADPPVSKVISGTKPASADEFTFKMVGASGAPMPDDATGDTVIRTLKGAGEVEMGYITYTAVGTYTYKISEVTGTSNNYTYDSTIFDMTVVVTDNNGQLEAVRTIEKNGAVVAKAEFDNVFSSGSEVLVDKVADKADATPGQNIDYTITVTNTGDSKVVGVWVKDTVPAGTSFVSCDAAGVVSADKSYVNWFVPELEPGATATFEMVVRVNDDVEDAFQITNTAQYEITANPDTPDFKSDPKGEDTPTASTKVIGGKTSASAAALKAAKSASTGDTALPLGFVAALVVGAGCIAYRARRRSSNK